MITGLSECELASLTTDNCSTTLALDLQFFAKGRLKKPPGLPCSLLFSQASNESKTSKLCKSGISYEDNDNHEYYRSACGMTLTWPHTAVEQQMATALESL